MRLTSSVWPNRILFLSLLGAFSLLTREAATASAQPKGTPNGAEQETSPSAALRAAESRTAGGQAFNYAGASSTETRAAVPYLISLGADGEEGSTESLPLKELSAKVEVAGVVAKVQLKQLFSNQGKAPIEALYVFPASTRAAVHAMRMTIGERVVEAKLARRAEARQEYEAAKKEGKRASLLEQQRPNVFTMNVANLMPGDQIAVELTYSELLEPEEGTYELVIPAVVGPRYTGGMDAGESKWTGNPYLKSGTPVPYSFDVKVHLEMGMALKELASPSHPIEVKYASTSSADVTLPDAGGGDRDFILRYRLADKAIEAGLLLYEDPTDGGFFALMMEPPPRPTAAQIPRREYIYLLDVSGSMRGFPLDTAKELMRASLGSLRATDTFNVVLFSGASHVAWPKGSVPATEANLAKAAALIDGQQGGGGTELMGGLTNAYSIPKADEKTSRSVIVITDGYVGVESQSFKFVRERLGEANLFSFGIGSSVNRALIEGMARAGAGASFVVLSKESAPAEATKLRAFIEQPVLTNISMEVKGLATSEVAPEKLPDLFARRPLLVFGRYSGPLKGSITVTGDSGGPFKKVFDLSTLTPSKKNEALVKLWARKWIEQLEDARATRQSPELEEAIARMGLKWKLLTSQTSFVAVDSEVVNKGGEGALVAQPLPLPQGVPESAVGRASGYYSMSRQKTLPGPATTLDLLPSESPPWRPEKATCGRVELSSKGSAGANTQVLLDELATFLKTKHSALCADAKASGATELTLVIDGKGKVSKVEAPTDPKLAWARKIARQLKGLKLSARAISGSGGRVVITLAIGG